MTVVWQSIFFFCVGDPPPVKRTLLLNSAEALLGSEGNPVICWVRRQNGNVIDRASFRFSPLLLSNERTSAEAVLSEGNVEPYLPNAWTEEEASVLAHLVGLYGPTNWGIIAAGVATKSETQVRKKTKRASFLPDPYVQVVYHLIKLRNFPPYLHGVPSFLLLVICFVSPRKRKRDE